jgi:hypothetical protein
LAEVLATSQQEEVIQQRESRREIFGWETTAQYQKMLEEKIQFDPLALANAESSQDVLMFLSEKDDVVPSPTQLQLWQAWGRPQSVNYQTGHAVTIGRVYLFSSREIANFLSDRRKTWQ